MSFKTKEEIYNEGCDSLIDELLERSRSVCAIYYSNHNPKAVDLDILLNELTKIHKEIQHYEKSKKA